MIQSRVLTTDAEIPNPILPELDGHDLAMSNSYYLIAKPLHSLQVERVAGPDIRLPRPDPPEQGERLPSLMAWQQIHGESSRRSLNWNDPGGSVQLCWCCSARRARPCRETAPPKAVTAEA